MTINRISNTQHGPARLPKPCKFCGTLGHLAFNCPKKPRKPLKATKGLTTKKRMNKVGRIGKALSKQRNELLDELPQPYKCFYCAFVGVETILEREFVNVEHTESKARHPELRFVKKNLVISCPGHNAMKQSKGVDEFLDSLQKQMEENNAH